MKRIKECIKNRINIRLCKCRSIQWCKICEKDVESGERYFLASASEAYHVKCLVNAIYTMESKRSNWLTSRSTADHQAGAAMFGGYSPIVDDLDESNPPRGGSGVNPPPA